MRKTHSFYFIFFSSFRLSLLRSVFGEYFIWTVFLFSYAGYLRNYSYQKKYLNYKNVSLFECCVFISYGSMKIQHFLPALILCRHQLIFPYFFFFFFAFFSSNVEKAARVINISPERRAKFVIVDPVYRKRTLLNV